MTIHILDWDGNPMTFSSLEMSVIGIYESDSRTEFIIHDNINYKIKYRKATKPSSVYCNHSRKIFINNPNLKQLAMSRPHNLVMKKDDIIGIMRYYHCEDEYDNLLSTLNAEVIDEYVFIKIDIIEEYLSNIEAIDDQRTKNIKEYFDNHADSSDSDDDDFTR